MPQPSKAERFAARLELLRTYSRQLSGVLAELYPPGYVPDDLTPRSWWAELDSLRTATDEIAQCRRLLKGLLGGEDDGDPPADHDRSTVQEQGGRRVHSDP